MSAKSAPLPKRRIIDFDIEIGRRVRVQRQSKELSQTELAQALGLTFQQIQKYEMGANRVSAGKLIQIATVLDVPLEVFFDGLVEIGKAQDDARLAHEAYRQAQNFAASAEGRRLCRAFLRIEKSETRRLLLRMIESLAEDD